MIQLDKKNRHKNLITIKYIYHIIITVILFVSCNSTEQKKENKLSNTEKISKVNDVLNKNIIYDTIWKDDFGENKFQVLKVENDEYQAETNIKMTFSLTNKKGTQELIDSISDCPVEFHMNLLKKSIKVIDVNQDNKKELLYAYACRGDMIGDTLKVVVIENNGISSIKGLRTNIMDEQIAEFEKRTSTGFGEITESNVPNHLKEEATKLWLKHSKEKSVKSDLEVEEYYNSK